MPLSLLSLLAAAGITLLLQTVASGLGPIGVLLNLVVPLPAAYVTMRYGWKIGAASVGLSAVVLLLLGGIMGLLAYLLQFGVGSLMLPVLLLRRWSWDKAVVVCLGVALILVGLALFSATTYQNVSLTTSIDQYVQSEIDTALKLADQSELSIEQQQQYRTTVTGMGDFLRETLPAWTVSVLGAMLLLQVFLLGVVANGKYLISGPGFSCWKIPEYLVWPLIASGFAVAFGGGISRLIGLNLLVVLLPVYFLHGLAVVTFYFQKKAVSPMLRAIGYTLIALLNPIPLIVIAIGVFDMWADFRKPRIKKI